MELASELLKTAESSVAKGRACYLEAEKLEGEAKSAKTVEGDKFMDDADAQIKRAERIHTNDQVEKKLADHKKPIRTVAIAGADTPELAAAMRKSVMRKAFDSYLRKGAGGWQANLIQGGLDEAQVKALSPLSDPEGGFLLREDLRSEVITLIRDQVQIEAMARVIDTDASVVRFPTANIKGSGVSVPFRAPAAPVAVMNLSNIFGKTHFTPHERMAIVKTPIELIEDSGTDIAGFLIQEIANEISEMKELDYLFGTGAASPWGLLSVPNTVFTYRDIAGSTTAVVAEDIIDLAYDIRGSHRAGAAYMMHRNTVRAVRKMRADTGGAGTGQFLWQPSFVAGQPAVLNGYPLIESEFFTDPFAQGAADGDAMALFGQFQSYWIVRRLALQVKRLEELYAASGEVGFQVRTRYDAAPVRSQSFARLNRK